MEIIPIKQERSIYILGQPDDLLFSKIRIATAQDGPELVRMLIKDGFACLQVRENRCIHKILQKHFKFRFLPIHL